MLEQTAWWRVFPMALLIVGCGSPVAPPSVAPPTPPVSSNTPATPERPDNTPIAAEVAPEEAASPVTAEITLQALDWQEVEAVIRQYAGKVVVMDVWSTSCEPCLREFPHLVALQERYSDDVVGISLNCDYVGIKKKPPEFYREKVSKVLEDQRAAKLVNVLCTMPSDDLFAALKISSIPAVFVYDRQGQLAHTFDNRTPAGDDEGISYEKQINPAVAVLVDAANK